MSAPRQLLQETAVRLFREHGVDEAGGLAEAGSWPEELWRAIEDSGLHGSLVPEEEGGAGVGLGDAMAVLQIAGRFARPVPLGETMIAAWLLSRGGLEVPAGPLSYAPVTKRDRLTLSPGGGGCWTLSGIVHQVPWAAAAKCLAVLAEAPVGAALARVTVDPEWLTQRTNLAGEPRETVHFERVMVAADSVSTRTEVPTREAALGRGALSRVALIAGALERTLELTLEHARDRVQFGRPIGKFQAVQQQLAVLAAETAAAGVAAEAAARCAEESAARFGIAAAKVRVSRAAGRGAAIAHQLHGAIGFTREHPLHQLTRRLWSWRDELGDESEWSVELGEETLEAGAAGLWPRLTG